jgi:hypothetical protein
MALQRKALCRVLIGVGIEGSPQTPQIMRNKREIRRESLIKNGSYALFCLFRPILAASPKSPVPSNTRLAGSGVTTGFFLIGSGRMGR